MHIALPQTAKNFANAVLFDGEIFKMQLWSRGSICVGARTLLRWCSAQSKDRNKNQPEKEEEQEQEQEQQQQQQTKKTNNQTILRHCLLLRQLLKWDSVRWHNFHTNGPTGLKPCSPNTPPWLTCARGRVRQRSGIVHGVDLLRTSCFWHRTLPSEDSLGISEDHVDAEVLEAGSEYWGFFLSSTALICAVWQHLLGQFWHRQSTILLGSARSQWCEARHEEVQTRERHQVPWRSRQNPCEN